MPQSRVRDLIADRRGHQPAIDDEHDQVVGVGVDHLRHAAQLVTERAVDETLLVQRHAARRPAIFADGDRGEPLAAVS